MVRCLLHGMEMASEKVVNSDKLQEITQLADENSAVFLNWLQDTMVQYTRLDPASPTGATVLATQFISQAAPDTRKKLRKVEDGPQTSIQELVRMAFKVFNVREESAESSRQQTANLQTQALAAALRSQEGEQGKPNMKLYPGGAQAKSTSQSNCFKCGLNCHTARYYTTPAPRLCYIC